MNEDKPETTVYKKDGEWRYDAGYKEGKMRHKIVCLHRSQRNGERVVKLEFPLGRGGGMEGRETCEY